MAFDRRQRRLRDPGGGLTGHPGGGFTGHPGGGFTGHPGGVPVLVALVSVSLVASGWRQKGF